LQHATLNGQYTCLGLSQTFLSLNMILHETRLRHVLAG
jgi:hypothetical protein